MAAAVEGVQEGIRAERAAEIGCGGNEHDGDDVAAADDCRQERSSKAAMKEDLMEVSMKAVHAAKEWGGYLFSIGKMTSGQVTKTAGYLKSAFDVQVFADDTHHENDDNMTDGDDILRRSSETAVAPWVGYSEAESMKAQILALSKDKQNFLRGPPAGVDFYFDYNVNYPLAQVMLEDDPNLQAMRFELVPKQVREETFWQNYFYRISLIKQSAKLTSLTKCSVLSQPSAVVDNKKSTISRTDDSDKLFHGNNAKSNQLLPDTFDDSEPDLDLDDFEVVNSADLDIDEETSK